MNAILARLWRWGFLRVADGSQWVRARPAWPLAELPRRLELLHGQVDDIATRAYVQGRTDGIEEGAAAMAKHLLDHARAPETQG